jgi:hypothetical protein
MAVDLVNEPTRNRVVFGAAHLPAWRGALEAGGVR